MSQTSPVGFLALCKLGDFNGLIFPMIPLNKNACRTKFFDTSSNHPSLWILVHHIQSSHLSSKFWSAKVGVCFFVAEQKSPPITWDHLRSPLWWCVFSCWWLESELDGKKYHDLERMSLKFFRIQWSNGHVICILSFYGPLGLKSVNMYQWEDGSSTKKNPWNPKEPYIMTWKEPAWASGGESFEVNQLLERSAKMTCQCCESTRHVGATGNMARKSSKGDTHI